MPATWYNTVSFSVQLLENYGVWKLSLHAAVSGFLAGKKSNATWARSFMLLTVEVFQCASWSILTQLSDGNIHFKMFYYCKQRRPSWEDDLSWAGHTFYSHVHHTTVWVPYYLMSLDIRSHSCSLNKHKQSKKGGKHWHVATLPLQQDVCCKYSLSFKKLNAICSTFVMCHIR